MKPKYWYVQTSFGVTIREGTVSGIRNAIGSENVESIRPAERKDIEWVRAMGGRLPPGLTDEFVP